VQSQKFVTLMVCLARWGCLQRFVIGDLRIRDLRFLTVGQESLLTYESKWLIAGPCKENKFRYADLHIVVH
jgi:hypothetical protein